MHGSLVRSAKTRVVAHPRLKRDWPGPFPGIDFNVGFLAVEGDATLVAAPWVLHDR